MNNDLNKYLFELIQVAVGTRSSLSSPSTCSGQAHLSADEWGELRLLFKKQGMLGIGYVGITKLPQPQCPPIQILAQWVHNAEKIRKKNETMSAACADVCKLLEHDGFGSCILKGQSNLPNYPADLRAYRTAGDIDVLCWPKGEIQIAEGDGKSAHYVTYVGKRAVIEYVLMQHRLSLPKQGDLEGLPEVQYHHVDWELGGTPVEVHFRASWLNNPFANRRLQRWTKTPLTPLLRGEHGFPIPSAGFNVVYQLVHINRHLFNEGIGLRQLLDYYFVLKTLPTSLLREETMQTLRSFHLAKFAGALMWVLQEAFAMPSDYLLCPPDEKRGRFLLNEIMLAGNFGRYDERNVISANESYVHRFIRRQKRFLRFLTQYPSEVLWAPYFSVTQRLWRMWHGWK